MVSVDFVDMGSKVSVLIPTKRDQTAWNRALNLGCQMAHKIAFSSKSGSA
jgi:hypothetical protein